MKNICFKNRAVMKIIKPTICLLIAGLFITTANQAIAQDDNAAPSKAKANMNVSYKKTDGVLSVKVAVTTKVEKKNVPVDGAMVSLYMNDVKSYDAKTGEGLLGRLAADQDGKIVFEMKDNAKDILKGKHDYKFVAELKGDPKYIDKQGEVEVKDANITITVTGKDTLQTATARLTEIKDDGTETPVVGAELKLGIKRSFSTLPFGGDALKTNENGEVSALIPSNVIGEADGTLIVIGKIEDNETYGNVQTGKAIPWTVMPKAIAENRRNLWSTGKNAPYSLVIVSVSMIGIIWGLLLYLVTFLFKIKKLGKTTSKK